MSILWQARALAEAVGAAGNGFDVAGIGFDTRNIAPGDLFVALKGERDGHDFVAEALSRGAAGALVSRDMPGPILRVDDTLYALTRLAAAARARTRAKIVAVTGSVGKTTTKEMLRRALSAFGTVHAAEASFNNHIGVPLTLARMAPAEDFGVFEIGMNHAGEILPLAKLVQPDIAIITSVDRAHLGLLGSQAAIAAEKASIFASLRSGGVAILPAESEYAGQLAAAIPSGARGLTFGGKHAEARLIAAASTPELCEIHADISGIAVRLRLAAPGRHMAMNALAVLCACYALGLDVAQAAAALHGFAPFAGRGARRGLTLSDCRQIILLDESYNASGASLRAALAVLALQPGRRIAVLGDMLELGDAARDEHLALRPAVLAGADMVFASGPLMGVLFESLPASMQGAHAPDAAALAPMLTARLRNGDTVLVKGSYGSRMRDVVSRLESPA